MGQRISFNQVFDASRINIQRNYGRLFDTQMKLSTGRRLLRPSDDAAQTGRLFGLVRQQEKIAGSQKTVGAVLGRLDASAANLEDVSEALHRARALALQGANGTLGAGERAAIAAELDELLQQVVSVANVRFEGRQLFSGTATGTRPFELVTGGDGLQRVDYRGNGEEQQVEIAPGVFATVNLPGSRVFASAPATATVFTGAAGAVPGAGNDSGRGRDVLEVVHTATAYGSPPGPGGQDPSTGLRPSATAAGNDTAMGTGHSVVVTTDAVGNGTISLNGGPSVPFTPAATNLAVDDGNGTVVHVDVSGLATGLPPTTVPLRGDGDLTTDGGATRVAIDFTSANQSVPDSETGAVLNVDSRGIRLSGTERVDYQDSGTIFDALIAIRDALTDPALSPSQIGAAVRSHVDDLDRGHQALLNGLAELGARHNRLTSTDARLEGLDVTLADLRSQIEDADLAEVTADLGRFETLYQSSLLMASRVNRLSLLEFI